MAVVFGPDLKRQFFTVIKDLFVTTTSKARMVLRALDNLLMELL